MKKSTYLIIIVVSLVAIIIGFSILVFNISRIDKKTESSNRKLPENVINHNAVSTSSSEIKVSPNATITKVCSYKKCGHTVTVSETIPNSFVNLTEDDFNKLYSEWDVTEFSPSSIKILRTFDGNCGEHFLVKDHNGYIAIYHIKDDDNFELIETTGIATKYLSQIDMNELENGVTLYGKEKLNAYIEDFE